MADEIAASDPLRLVAVKEFDKLDNRLDPTLQELCLQHYRTPDRAIPILARVKHERSLPSLLKGRIVTRTGNIVTARVPVIDIIPLRSQVESLKASPPLYAELDLSLTESLANIGIHDRRGDRRVDYRGKGVVVGIIDFGFDFNHPALNDRESGRGHGQVPKPFGYGVEYEASAIEKALQAIDPYRALGYDPERHYFQQVDINCQDRLPSGLHATAVADVAVGRDGVAPEAEIIFVQLARSLWDGVNDFGNVASLLEAADYIFQRASKLRPGAPVVINISLNARGGPHDGSTLLEQGLDALLSKNNRAIVVAAGNANDQSGHLTRRLAVGRSVRHRWAVRRGSETRNELEIWYSGDAVLEVQLVTPDGQSLGWVPLGQTHRIVYGDKDVGRIFNRRDDPNNHDNHIDIVLRPKGAGLPETLRQDGTWQVDLRAISAGARHQFVEYHIWLEREIEHVGRQSRLLEANFQGSTLGSIANGRQTIVVGSHRVAGGHPPSGFSARGPVRRSGYSSDRDLQKPDLTAPGEGISRGEGLLVARAKTADKTTAAGTSIGAPHCAGVVALMMEKAVVREGRTLTAEEILKVLRGPGSRHRTFFVTGHRPVEGFGRLDGEAAIDAI
jgi:subtilisin family serine protease